MRRMVICPSAIGRRCLSSHETGSALPASRVKSRISLRASTDRRILRAHMTADLELLDAYWRAANYLSVGQIYLLDNPLLREPLRLEHVKPRLLGHWGTTPGL